MNFTISFPPSASSAKSAVNAIAENDLAAVVSTNIERVDRRRQSILQKVFTGKLLTADDADHTDKK